MIRSLVWPSEPLFFSNCIPNRSSGRTSAPIVAPDSPADDMLVRPRRPAIAAGLLSSTLTTSSPVIGAPGRSLEKMVCTAIPKYGRSAFSEASDCGGAGALSAGCVTSLELPPESGSGGGGAGGAEGMRGAISSV